MSTHCKACDNLLPELYSINEPLCTICLISVRADIEDEYQDLIGMTLDEYIAMEDNDRTVQDYIEEEV